MQDRHHTPKKINHHHLNAFCFLCLLALLGCPTQETAPTTHAPSPDASRSQPQDAPAPQKNATTDLGTEAPAPKQHIDPKVGPQRIVSFVPGLTEIAFDIGLGPRVVGVSSFDTWPPEVQRIERVGGLLDPNLEKLLTLRPDLLLLQPAFPQVQALAQRQNIPFVSVRTDTLDDLFAAYTAIGLAAHCEPQAQARLAALKLALANVSAPPGARRIKTLLVVGRQDGTLVGLTAAGPGTFLDAALHMAGGQNVLTDPLIPWPQVSKEVLLANPPEVIIELSPGAPNAPGDAEKALAPWKDLQTLAPVHQGRLHRLTADHLLIPGPRVIDTIKALRACLEPIR